LPKHRALVLFALLVSSTLWLPPAAAQDPERARAIAPPLTSLPPEADTRNATRFSFIVYGDTRGRQDGTALQYEHSLVVNSMLAEIKRLHDTQYPVRFVLQSGDAVVNGRDAHQWNTSFIPLINRLTAEGGVPYFPVAGNHDVTPALTADAPERQPGLRNYLDAFSALIPANGSPRRLSGYPTYAVAYGNTLVLAIDSNIAADDKQYQWVKGQLEGLDRSRYVNVIALFHHPPFSSGPHGGSNVEAPTAALRSRYMPLFHTHHVRAVFSGHDHLFEHWVERYSDATGPHRMDLVVSGGGGAPLYTYQGEPNLSEYLRANESSKAALEHLVKPGVEPGSSPYHFLIVRVDNEHLDMEVHGVDWGSSFRPYRTSTIELRDQPH
jgi:Calcineurin-like phosphoesterase